MQSPGDVLHQINLNRFFKLIRDTGFTIVLIHLSPPQNQTRFERLLKELRKILGNHFINKIPPQYHTDVTARISLAISPEELNRFKKAHQIRRFIQSHLFAMSGEGTGQRLDLDEFDLYYRQLIIWDRTEGRIVGGYRIGCGDEICRQYGKHGFYISTLFRIKKNFEPILLQSLELGRSSMSMKFCPRIEIMIFHELT